MTRIENYELESNFEPYQKIFNFKEDFRISIKQEIEIKKNQKEVKKEKDD